MSTRKIEEYHCDNCGKKLSTHHNNVEIVTSKNEGSWWSRLHVVIQHIHGVHNEATKDAADLCQECAIIILEDALYRVKNGERISAGVEEPKQKGWNS